MVTPELLTTVRPRLRYERQGGQALAVLYRIMAQLDVCPLNVLLSLCRTRAHVVEEALML